MSAQGPAERDMDVRTSSGLAGLKPLVLAVVAWEFLLVLWASLYSPPMGSFGRDMGLPSSLVNFPVLDSLFFHSLALPLAAVLILITLGAFDVRGRLRSAIKYAATAGGIATSGIMEYILVTGGSSGDYILMYVGLAFEAGAAIALLIALLPRKDPSSGMRLVGRDLTRIAMWVVTAGGVVAVSLGAYAATANGQWNPSTTLAQMSGFETIHENLIITLIGSAVVVLAVKWFCADRYTGTPGLFIKIGLYGLIVGVPIVVISMLSIASSGVGLTGGITMYIGILLQAALFVMFAIMYGEGKRLHVRSPLAVLRESLTFGMLFVLFWVNVAVTLPGVYVAANLARFNGQFLGFYYNEVFVIGHGHALVTLTAISLMMLVALMFGVKGILGAVAGLTMTAGYVIATLSNVFYMFYLIPNGQVFVSYISDGIALIFIGVIAAVLGMVLSRGGSRTVSKNVVQVAPGKS